MVNLEWIAYSINRLKEFFKMVIRLLDLKDEMMRNGEFLIDFTENNFRVNYLDPDLTIKRVILVEDEQICRLDLICFEAYGNLDYIDALLKFNQITNPFSIDEFDLILVPSEASLNKYYKKEKKLSKIIKDTKSLFLDPSKASEKDKTRLEQLEKIAKKRKNGSVTPKPTNLLREGEVPFSTDGRRLIFAPTVSTPRFPSSNDSNS